MKLPCPNCGGATVVVGTQVLEKEAIIKRRRKCRRCLYAFRTIELSIALAKKIMRPESLPKVAQNAR